MADASKSSADTEDGSTSTSSSDGHKSLLDVLKPPQRSEFSRKRWIAQNLPHDDKLRIIAKISNSNIKQN